MTSKPFSENENVRKNLSSNSEIRNLQQAINYTRFSIIFDQICSENCSHILWFSCAKADSDKYSLKQERLKFECRPSTSKQAQMASHKMDKENGETSTEDFIDVKTRWTLKHPEFNNSVSFLTFTSFSHKKLL